MLYPHIAKGLQRYPAAHQGYVLMTVPVDAAGLDYIATLRFHLADYNRRVERAKRLYLKISGRLGKNNPAYGTKYARHYASIRNEDATRFDVYLLTRDYQMPDRHQYVRDLVSLACPVTA